MMRVGFINSVVCLLVVLVLSVPGQTTQSKQLKKIHITSRTITSQRSGQSYVIDFTRRGTVYRVAGNIDLVRIRIRTATGEASVSDLVTSLGIKRGRTGVNLLLGNDEIKDLHSQVDRSTTARMSSTQQFECTEPSPSGRGACKCTDIIDCVLMGTKNPWCKIIIIDLDTGVTYCRGPLGPDGPSLK